LLFSLSDVEGLPVCDMTKHECVAKEEVTCTPDEKRCNADDTAVETCNTAGDAWESVDCGMGEVCNPTSTECEVEDYCIERCYAVDNDGDTECTGNAACNDLGDGNFYCTPTPNEVAEIGEQCDHVGKACNSSEAWCLGYSDTPNYCFKKCNAAAQSSAECDGNPCYSFGNNEGFYCAVPNTKYIGEECSVADNCLSGGKCIKFGDKSYCYKECSAENNSTPECDGKNCFPYGDDPETQEDETRYFLCNPL